LRKKSEVLKLLKNKMENTPSSVGIIKELPGRIQEKAGLFAPQHAYWNSAVVW